MEKFFRSFKSKKGFTLVELIAVMALIAIATAIVLPNISGMISKKKESTYKSFCMEATSYVRGYTNMLTQGEETVPYEDKNGATKYYTITTGDDFTVAPDGLTNALNEYNLESSYQYYVLPYQDSSASYDPSVTVRDLLSKNKLLKNKKDVMIVVINAKEGGRVPLYTLKGFWYFAYDQDAIVYSYYVPSKRSKVGFQKLTSSGK